MAQTRRRAREWQWVQRSAIAPDRRPETVNGTLETLIEKGWAESDGNGRVRPSPEFPDWLVAALASLDA